ncbi:metal-dependent hydrolase [Fictibacillus nanhaiensis]|uniref:metal-dependent hydrolase n=1 Tax=Fictibacillus nanhaiensis TaxID=742169 RepID=UPI001C96752F|nr:metal-dependent hydrolase [Fictibacillus nanhaiensis]MBY6038194.1 metal-dependent hydrolase [Fictibacillus nanhaiensis]
MDTTSHIVIGLGLGALAQIDPVVANSSLSSAVVLGTVIGSNAPDSDCIYKLKGKGSYFRNHRGWSHSLPALPLWGLAISGIIHPFFPDSSFLHLFLWTFLAVILHVGFDLFNVYGTQSLKPFSSKWVSFDCIPLVDPLILGLHVTGFVLMLFFEPGIIFLWIYGAISLHLLYRTVYAVRIHKHLRLYYPVAKRIKVIPRPDLLSWDFLIETKEEFIFGSYTATKIKIEHKLVKKEEYLELIADSKKERDISDFLASTEYAYPFVKKSKTGYFVMWKDLRFRMNKTYFPYLSILFISEDSTYKATYTDKLYSLKSYRKVMRDLEYGSIRDKKFVNKPYLRTS